jgi:hypothetical protein
MVRKKTSGRKITLQKSSVRQLTDDAIEKAKGGQAAYTATNDCGDGGTDTCGGNSVCVCNLSPPSPGCVRRTQGY